MNGHFFGVHVAGGEYNVAGIKVPFWGFKKDYRYEGWEVRAGVTYGYHWALNHHWSIEALLGLGVVHTKYDQFECKNCGKNVGKKTKTFFAPTRLALNLAYTFGKSKARTVRTITLPGENTVTVNTDTIIIREKAETPGIEKMFPFVHRVGQPSSGTHMPVRYRLDNSVLDEDYSQNREHLATILNALDLIFKSDTIRVARVDVAGYASPEGPLEHNIDLGQNRANALKAYILEKEPRLSADMIQATSGGEDWYGLRKLVVESDMVGKDQVLNIIDNVPEAQRKDRLKTLNGGRTYRSIFDVLYPQLRSACYIDVWYDDK
jgi:outer membrane protein OmpA-like peptidoglycan-associated protein